MQRREVTCLKSRLVGRRKKEGQVEGDPVVGFRKEDGTTMCDCERSLENPFKHSKENNNVPYP